MAVEVADSATVLAASIGTGRRSRAGRVNKSLAVGLSLLVLIIAACLGAPLITHYDPTAQNLLIPAAPPFTYGHLLGTDAPYGRDVFSRLLYGGRIDLLIAFGATGVTLISGTLIGLVSGYLGGLADTIIMRIVDVFFAFPFLVLVLAIVAMLGPGLMSLFIAIWAVGWVSYARIIRGETLAARKQEYVLAAEALGYHKGRIMLRHILPNIFSAALIFSMVDAVANILIGASLGYFGLGVPQPTPEWGSMVADGQLYMVSAWWVPALPGLAIVLVGTAFSLTGDGLADVLRRGRAT
ncbi:MAG TPA: ABC transporter permease [Chloroflexota bacterium]|nr:ABC transporter permease [Chloroflexota bacterium]